MQKLFEVAGKFLLYVIIIRMILMVIAGVLAGLAILIA